jgi:hypothetical protein
MRWSVEYTQANVHVVLIIGMSSTAIYSRFLEGTESYTYSHCPTVVILRLTTFGFWEATQLGH